MKYKYTSAQLVCQATFTIDTNIASSRTSTRDNVHVYETSVNAETEHLVMAKSDSLAAQKSYERT